MKQDTIIILDYGSQYTRLISRRLREMNIFCDLVSPDIDKAFFERKPPEDTIVKAKLKESKNLILTMLYAKIIKIVVSL